MTTLTITPSITRLTLTGPNVATLVLNSQSSARLVLSMSGTQGPPGPAGTPAISTDAGNIAAIGTDGKLFVPPPSYVEVEW
jgi:hypothetical protein